MWFLWDWHIACCAAGRLQLWDSVWFFLTLSLSLSLVHIFVWIFALRAPALATCPLPRPLLFFIPCPLLSGLVCASSHSPLDLCIAVPSSKSLHVLSSSTSGSQPQGHPLRVPPCPSVCRAHSPLSTPCLLSSSCLAILKTPCFVWFCCLSVSHTSVECQVFENKHFVLFTIMSPQHLAQYWCHSVCTWVPAVGLNCFCGCTWPSPASSSMLFLPCEFTAPKSPQV